MICDKYKQTGNFLCNQSIREIERKRWLLGLLIIPTLMDLSHDENEARYKTDWGDEGREQQQLGLVLLDTKRNLS